MISTTGDLIQFVLKASGILGVGQSASDDDTQTGLDFLRMIIAQWQRKRWLVFVEQTVGVASSTGAQSYSIGPGGDFNCGRPDHIAAAYVRILNANNPNLVDIPLSVVEAMEDYSQISLKNLATFPACVFYESGYPLGRLWFWPVPPAAQYGLYVVVKLPLPTYTALTDALDLPDEYIEALTWSLCVRMQMAYGLQAKPDQVAAMQASLNTLRQANTQVPTLRVGAPNGAPGVVPRLWITLGY
jgi:hypothetical protein